MDLPIVRGAFGRVPSVARAAALSELGGLFACGLHGYSADASPRLRRGCAPRRRARFC